MGESFWPDLPRERMRTPHSILLEQANFLSKMTRGLLVGRATLNQYQGEFYSILTIVAPGLNNYTYEVCRIYYPINLYPCKLHPFGSHDERHDLANEGDLINALKEVLHSKEIARVMTGLLSQIQADEDEEVPF